MLFKDREDAGNQLANYLGDFQDEQVLVLLVPRGGMEIGLETIKRYDYDWDLVIPRKISAPHNKEFAIGAVTVDGNYLLYEEYINHLGVTQDYIDEKIKHEVTEIKRRLKTYRGSDTFPDVFGKTVIVMDDGVATGFTLLAAIKSIKNHHPAKIILAVPVAPLDTIEAFKQFVDEIICIHAAHHFTAVGAYYENFEQVTDDEMKSYIVELNQNKVIV